MSIPNLKIGRIEELDLICIDTDMSRQPFYRIGRTCPLPISEVWSGAVTDAQASKTAVQRFLQENDFHHKGIWYRDPGIPYDDLMQRDRDNGLSRAKREAEQSIIRADINEATPESIDRAIQRVDSLEPLAETNEQHRWIDRMRREIDAVEPREKVEEEPPKREEATRVRLWECKGCGKIAPAGPLTTHQLYTGCEGHIDAGWKK